MQFFAGITLENDKNKTCLDCSAQSAGAIRGEEHTDHVVSFGEEKPRSTWHEKNAWVLISTEKGN